MSNFVWNNTALPAEKADAVDMPSAASETNYITGQNFNDLMSALDESRQAAWKGGGRIAPQAAAPASGTFEVGDLVFNSVPANGGNVGWVCITAGTPGSWLEFGAIAADVLNGGEGGGGGTPGASDIETPERLYGTNAAELGFYAAGLAGGRQGALGFLSASSTILELRNEKSSAAIIRLTPGTGGWVEVEGTGEFECTELWTDHLYPKAGSDQPLSLNTEDVRIVGSNEAWLGLYPDGAASLRATFGFDDDASDTLYVKNQQAANGHVHLVPGSGAGLKVGGLADSNLATVKGIRVFTTTDNWTGKGTNSGDNYDYTVSGIAVGDHIISVTNSGLLSASSGDGTAGHQLTGNVVATNSVNVTWRNYSGGTVEPISGTITIVWLDLT